MKMFDIYYSGVVSIEAETEEEARYEFFNKYVSYGDIDYIEDVTKEWEDWIKYLTKEGDIIEDDIFNSKVVE